MTKGKVHKRIRKYAREKKNREHFNDLFLELSHALGQIQRNTGKATILSQATRLFKELLGQIESLRNQNVSLLSETNYMTVEKNELREDTSALETHIERLQSELQERVIQSEPNLNVPPSEVAFHFLPDLQIYQPADAARRESTTNSNISKPRARYPTNSWPF